MIEHEPTNVNRTAVPKARDCLKPVKIDQARAKKAVDFVRKSLNFQLPILQQQYSQGAENVLGMLND